MCKLSPHFTFQSLSSTLRTSRYLLAHGYYEHQHAFPRRALRLAGALHGRQCRRGLPNLLQETSRSYLGHQQLLRLDLGLGESFGKENANAVQYFGATDTDLTLLSVDCAKYRKPSSEVRAGTARSLPGLPATAALGSGFQDSSKCSVCMFLRQSS